MLTGFIGVVTGYVTVWYESWDPDQLGRSIGISVGGACQLIGQVTGVFFVRYHRVMWLHIWSMSAVFFCGCIIPGLEWIAMT